jgi:transposase
MAYDAELLDLRLVAVDGTRIAANAAGDQMLTGPRLAQLALAVDARIAEVEAQGQPDDGPSEDLPPDWRHLIAKKRRIEAARERIAAGARKANLTDPDAHQMTAKGINTPAYNAQAAVAGLVAGGDADDSPGVGGRVIVGARIRTRADDRGCLAEMIVQVTETVGELPAATVADVGYYSGAELAACADLPATVVMPEQFERRYDHAYGIRHFPYDPATDTMQCPEGTTLTRWGRHEPGREVRYAAPTPVCRVCPAREQCCPHSQRGRVVYRSSYPDAVEAHRTWMAQPEAQALARRRSGLVEGVFGTLRIRHRAHQWLHRGREAIEAEWTLLTAAFNLHTLHRAWTGTYGPTVQTRLVAWLTGIVPTP